MHRWARLDSIFFYTRQDTRTDGLVLWAKTDDRTDKQTNVHCDHNTHSTHYIYTKYIYIEINYETLSMYTIQFEFLTNKMETAKRVLVLIIK